MKCKVRAVSKLKVNKKLTVITKLVKGAKREIGWEKLALMRARIFINRPNTTYPNRKRFH